MFILRREIKLRFVWYRCVLPTKQKFDISDFSEFLKENDDVRPSRGQELTANWESRPPWFGLIAGNDRKIEKLKHLDFKRGRDSDCIESESKRVERDWSAETAVENMELRIWT